MDNLLLAKFLTQPVVRDRNLVALLAWSARIAAQPVPASAPSASEVKVRLLAERVPSQIENYVQRMMAYFLQDGTVQLNIRQHLNPFNHESVEEALAAELNSVIDGFALRFAELEISDSQALLWLTEHYPTS
jgi:hypothetical protein